MQNRDALTWVAVVVAVVLVVGLLGGAFMGFGMMWPGMMGGFGPGLGTWGGVLMMLFWVLIVGGVVLLVTWLVRQLGAASSTGSGAEGTALEILKRRYARGEITKEQFEQTRRDLE